MEKRTEMNVAEMTPEEVIRRLEELFDELRRGYEDAVVARAAYETAARAKAALNERSSDDEQQVA